MPEIELKGFLHPQPLDPAANHSQIAKTLIHPTVSRHWPGDSTTLAKTEFSFKLSKRLY